MSNVHTYHFPFLSHELKLEFVKNIDSDLADLISDLIQILKNDLSHKYANSSAHKLNNAGKKFPVVVSPDFIEFFETSIKYFLATSSEFNPFNKEVDKFNLEGYFLINNHENTIIKLDDFKFDSALLKFFIIQKIVNLLNLNNVKDYYLNYVDIAASFGEVTWKAKFHLTDFNKEVEFKLHNKFAFIFTPDHEKEVKGYTKFANVDQEVKASHILLKGNNLLDLKILALEMEHLKWLHQYKEFAKENRTDIIVYT